MPSITIDGRPASFTPGETILEAASRAGIAIPTLCYLPGHPPQGGCGVCVVQVAGEKRLLPACATRARDGMMIASDCDEVRAVRRGAIELLLSDHLGDCLAPCHVACPAALDIPALLRAGMAGDDARAREIIHAALPFPATLSYVCPGFCESACRRGQHDAAVAIRLLHRLEPAVAAPRRMAGAKRVAIVGAGPAGLAAADRLLRHGYACTLFEARDRAGGGLLSCVEEGRLPADTLAAEVAVLLARGAELRVAAPVADAAALASLRASFDAVLLAPGPLTPETAERLGLPSRDNRVAVDKRALLPGLDGVFAAGGLTAPLRHAVRAVAAGQAAAHVIQCYLSGEAIVLPARPFSVHMGRLQPHELARMLEGVSPAGRVLAEDRFTPEFIREEASRCLHCDCRKPDACRLRELAVALDAHARQYAGERREYELDRSRAGIVFEPGKCIDCGRCVRITESLAEPLGLAYIGRGFTMRVGVPFSATLLDGLQAAARACIEACPTGALAGTEE